MGHAVWALVVGTFVAAFGARLRMSTSWRNCRFSRHNAANSSRSEVVSPSLRLPASRSACLTLKGATSG
jgi:hypothetical protein